MPGTGETAETRLARALSLTGTPGQRYVEKRGIGLYVAHDAGVRFEPDWNGRSAVIAGMRDAEYNLRSVHGRFLEHLGHQNKMLTIGTTGGVINVRGGLSENPIILVEGLFDALSLAMCGYGSVATVGRWAPWLPESCAGKTVWLGFDGNRPGDEEAARYRRNLTGADTRRLPPPGRSKDWNTALLKRGQATVEAWLRQCLGRAR
jgi:hypothetical protein